MPNWTSNDVRVRATNKKDIADFIKKYFTVREHSSNGELRFDFDKVIPQPRKEEDCPKDCLMQEHNGVEVLEDRPWFNWYNWNNKFWDTKWNACDTQFSVSEDGLTLDLYFLTAWSAPHPIFRELKRQNGHLRIRVESEDE